MGKRFDRTMMAGLTGMLIALAVSGCANLGQQNAAANSADASDASATSGGAATTAVTAASAPSTASPAAGSSPATPGAQAAAPLKKMPPLVYRVRHGDTLARIAQHHHCSVKQLQAWNSLKGSSRLKPGQVLHVASPETVRAVNAANAAAKAAANAAANAAAANAATQAAVASKAAPALAAQQAQSSQTAQAAQAAQTTEAAQAAQAAQRQPDPATAPAPARTPPTELSAAETREVIQESKRHANGVALIWPAGGQVVEAFQPGETRGIEIAGKPGDPVRAAADGKVMYAGTGLNGYGSLIIVQHNKDFLTAYSHNRKLLVKIGDVVRQGQQIAEMGDENNSRVSVGFELRHDGKPIDPMPYLPHARG